MSYTRYFINFNCEAENYGNKGKTPSGSCVLEARGNEGKLSCFAQNLKPETLYSVYALFPDGERFAGMPCGSLSVDFNGKAQHRHVFQADRILNGRYKLSDCAAIAVLAARAADITSPLCGYLKAPVSWRRVFYDATVKIGPQPLSEPVPVEAAVPVTPTPVPKPVVPVTPAPLPKPAVSAAPAPVKATVPFKTAPLPEPVTHIMLSPVEKAAPSAADDTCECPPETGGSFREVAMQFKKEIDKLSAETQEQAVPCPGLKENLEQFFTTYPAEQPFQKQNRSAKWVKVPFKNETVPPPINAPDLFDEPFVKTACERGGHTLLGITEGSARRQYIIGIPERYDPASRITANLLGFTQFKPCDDVRAVRGQDGYWLMFVNM